MERLHRGHGPSLRPVGTAGAGVDPRPDRAGAPCELWCFSPIAAALVELFPTRIRYTSMSLPYQLRQWLVGWPGCPPSVAGPRGRRRATTMPGCGYPVVVATASAAIGLLLLPETKDRDLTDTAPVRPGRGGPAGLKRQGALRVSNCGGDGLATSPALRPGLEPGVPPCHVPRRADDRATRAGNRNVMHRRSLFALSAAGLAAPTVLRAQGGWPDRPLRLVIPFPPGGSTDTIARLFQPKLAEGLGRQHGDRQPRRRLRLYRRHRDGCAPRPTAELWVLAYDNEATNQTVMRLPYRAVDAFAPVSLVATGPLALVAHKDTPYRTFQEVVDAARRAPDTIGYATRASAASRMSRRRCWRSETGIKPDTCALSRGWPCRAGRGRGQRAAVHVECRDHQPAYPRRHAAPLGVTTRGETRHVPGARSFAQQGAADFEAPTWWAFFGRARHAAPRSWRRCRRR